MFPHIFNLSFGIRKQIALFSVPAIFVMFVFAGCSQPGGKLSQLLRDADTVEEALDEFSVNSAIKDKDNNVIGANLSVTDVEDGDLLTLMEKIGSIRVLYLNEVENITDKGLEHIGKMTDLEELSFRLNTRITDEGLSKLGSLTNLKKLDLYACSNITDKGFENFKESSKIEELILTGTKITSDSIEAAVHFPNLKKIEANSTNVDDDALKALEGKQNLTLFDFSSTEITDEGLKYISKNTNLVSIGFGDTKISNEGLKHLYHLKKLKYIVGYDNEGVTKESISALDKALPLWSPLVATLSGAGAGPNKSASSNKKGKGRKGRKGKGRKKGSKTDIKAKSSDSPTVKPKAKTTDKKDEKSHIEKPKKEDNKKDDTKKKTEETKKKTRKKGN